MRITIKCNKDGVKIGVGAINFMCLDPHDARCGRIDVEALKGEVQRVVEKHREEIGVIEHANKVVGLSDKLRADLVSFHGKFNGNVPVLPEPTIAHECVFGGLVITTEEFLKWCEAFKLPKKRVPPAKWTKHQLMGRGELFVKQLKKTGVGSLYAHVTPNQVVLEYCKGQARIPRSEDGSTMGFIFESYISHKLSDQETEV